MRAARLCLPTLLILACGNSDSASQDAGAIDAQVFDATPADAGAPDAFDPCPGATTFEVGMVDWQTGDTLAGVLVQEVGTTNSATSAPNGRVVLCVSGTGPLELSLTKTDYVERVHTTTVEATGAQYATGQALSFRMITETDADALYDGVKRTRDVGASTFIAMVTDANTGLALAGATVAITAAEQGAYTPDGADLTAGSTTVADGRVLFLNAAIGAGSTTVMVSGPTGCEIPATVALAEASSVSIACQP